MPAHKHAENMKLFAHDAMATDKPWLRWQIFRDNSWVDMNDNPGWNPYMSYRRKPRTININGFEVPEPLRVAPENMTEYYLADTSRGYGKLVWRGQPVDMEWLAAGICHLTAEAAELHTRALLSFTATPAPSSQP